jgi:hypothetical protein
LDIASLALNHGLAQSQIGHHPDNSVHHYCDGHHAEHLGHQKTREDEVAPDPQDLTCNVAGQGPSGCAQDKISQPT